MSAAASLRVRAVRVGPRSALAVTVACVVGLVAFLWPFVVAPGRLAGTVAPPVMFGGLLLLVLAIVFYELAEGGIDAKAIAADDITDLAREIQGRCETAMRAAIRALPDGTYRSELQTDGVHDTPITMMLELTIKGERGLSMFKEYDRNAEATASAFDAEGFFRTGDRVTLLEDGWIKFSDRARIWQSIEILPKVSDFSNYFINAEVGVESALTKKTSLRAYVQDTYYSVPAPGRLKNDVKLVTAIAYKF